MKTLGETVSDHAKELKNSLAGTDWAKQKLNLDGWSTNYAANAYIVALERINELESQRNRLMDNLKLAIRACRNRGHLFGWMIFGEKVIKQVEEEKNEPARR